MEERIFQTFRYSSGWSLNDAAKSGFGYNSKYTFAVVAFEWLRMKRNGDLLLRVGLPM